MKKIAITLFTTAAILSGTSAAVEASQPRQSEVSVQAGGFIGLGWIRGFMPRIPSTRPVPPRLPGESAKQYNDRIQRTNPSLTYNPNKWA